MGETKITTVGNNKPDSCATFNPHYLSWKVMGISKSAPKGHLISYIFYSLLVNVLFTICYPTHLALLLFRSDTHEDNIKNLAITITSFSNTVKILIYFIKMPTIKKFGQILKKLDESVNDGLEMEHFRQLERRQRRIALIVIVVYVLTGIAGAISILLSKERTLLYPAWFPFDYTESTWKFSIASLYQMTGLSYIIIQEFANDCFPAMALCILSGHIELLSIRVASIGYDEKSLEDNEKKLNGCIQDQNNLYELYATIEDIISLPMFVQFCVIAANICISIATLFFYSSGAAEFLYNLLYFLALPLEIYPTCYYGSDFQSRFDQLHRGVYKSNWIQQSVKYKKHMMLFTERSLKQNVAMAGGIVRIHLDTFVATCRGAYSLFAILARLT